MKKVLVLDDDKSRMAKFFLNKQDTDLRQVWNAADCIEALKEGGWSLCSLDHDLRQVPYDDPGIENCGTFVAKWVAENKPDVQEFITHSYNHVQAPIMTQIIADAGYKSSWQPFSL